MYSLLSRISLEKITSDQKARNYPPISLVILAGGLSGGWGLGTNIVVTVEFVL